MVATLYRFESYYTHHFMSLWRNRQDANGSKPFCYGFNSHQTYHFIEGSHSGLVQWFAKSPNKFIVPRVQIPLPLPYIGVWCNGSITLSKSADWGSNPCTPASVNSFMAKSICKSIVE